MRRAAMAVCVAATMWAGEKKGQRPEVVTPTAYRGAEGQATAESLGDVRWFELFEDGALQRLIRRVLERNADLEMAAARVAQAQAQAGLSRAERLPSVGAEGSLGSQKNPSTPFFGGYTAQTSQLGLTSVWQLDFWGRYRKAAEAARAALAASEAGRKAVVVSLVAQVTTAYLGLREADLELEIAKRTLGVRRESLELTRTLERHGGGTLLDVRQAEMLVEAAARRIPQLEERIARQENLISFLAGDNPGPVERGQELTAVQIAPKVPAGLPSGLLERRPDIVQAERRLAAANAQVEVARRMYFPQLSLTGSAGFLAYSATGLFSSNVHSAAVAMTAPIFDFGRIRAGVRLSEAQRQELVAGYRQAVQQAFREVADALSGVEKSRAYRERQEELTKAAGEAGRLAELRYRGGASSYFEVLTSQNALFDAELELAQARLAERSAVVELYSALGGGWKQ